MSNNFETKKTIVCNNYMDDKGYKNLLSERYVADRNHNDIWLDKLGQDVVIVDKSTQKQIWVDEKFCPSNLNGQKEPIGRLPIALLLHESGDIRRGMLTESYDRYQADIWLWGTPYGISISRTSSMEIHAAWTHRVREILAKRTGLSMDDLFNLGAALLEEGDMNKELQLIPGYDIHIWISEKKTKVNITFPLSVITEVGFHGFC